MSAAVEDDRLCWWPVTELAARIRAREVSSVEAVDRYLARIERVDPGLGAYVTVTAAAARAAAAVADRLLASGKPVGRLHGVPVAIKDLDDVAGVRTGYGSRAWTDVPPARSATYVQRLLDAGAIVLGKTNVPEFGHKAVTDSLATGPANTPFGSGANAGGSSGGSAAAVAAGLAAAAQAGDGGGSIRIPAALCGVYGLKGTYGRVASAMRPDAFNSHTPFIHAGPVTRTVEDGALLLDVMSGPDSRDPLSLPDDGVRASAGVGRPIDGLRVALMPDFGGYPVEPDVRALIEAAAAALETEGAIVELVELPLPIDHAEVTALWLRHMGANYVGIVEGLRAAGDDLLARRDRLEEPVVAMIEAAAAMTVADVKRDELLATRLLDWVEDLLTEHDLVLSATVAVSRVPNAPDRRTTGPATVAGEPVDPRIGWCLTPATNFTGHPAASVPAGLTPDGYPVGAHLLGRRFADDVVVAASAAIERVRPWQHLYARSSP